MYDYYWIEDTDNSRSIFIDCTDATEASLPAVYNKTKYDENFNKIGYSSTSTLGQVFKYGKDGAGNKKYRDGQPSQVAKFGALKFGTEGIQYAASPGVKQTAYNYKTDTFTDCFGKTYRFESGLNKSRTYYPNNTYTEKTFDEYGRLTSITHKKTNKTGSPEEYNTETTLESLTYQYDNNQNITKITYANGEYTDYTYDSLNRLTTEERKTETGDRIYKIEYKFDNNNAKNGNIHQVIVNDTDTTTFTYNEMNELTAITHPDSSTETLTYDNNGNLTQTTRSGEVTFYQWDCHDRLIKVTLPPKNGAEAGEEVNFTYNGEDELIKIDYPDISVDMQESKGDFVKRIAKFKFNKQETPTEIEASTYNIFVRGQLLCKYGNTPDAASTSRNDGKNTGEPRFYHYDHNGNTAIITDRFGNITEKNLMDAYGNVLPLENRESDKPAITTQESLIYGVNGINYIHKIKMYNFARNFYNQINRNYLKITPVDYDNISFNSIETEDMMYKDNYNNSTISPYSSYEYYKGQIGDVFDYSDKTVSRKTRLDLKHLIENAISFCPKIGDFMTKHNGFNDNTLPRRIRFYIKPWEDKFQMGVKTNKFRLSASEGPRNPVYFRFRINSKLWNNRENHNPLELVAMIIHEFVHLIDDWRMDYNTYTSDFTKFALKGGAEYNLRKNKVCSRGVREYKHWTIVSEFRAYLMESMQLFNFKLPKLGSKVYEYFLYWSEFYEQEDCCIMEKYKYSFDHFKYC